MPRRASQHHNPALLEREEGARPGAGAERVPEQYGGTSEVWGCSRPGELRGPSAQVGGLRVQLLGEAQAEGFGSCTGPGPRGAAPPLLMVFDDCKGCCTPLDRTPNPKGPGPHTGVEI